MGISDGLYSVADIRIVGLSAVRGIGTSRLQFSLELNINATPGRVVTVGNALSFVFAGQAQSDMLQPLGSAVAETCWFTQTGEHSRRDGFMLILDLTGEQLAALEGLRSGGPLFFRVDLHMLVQGNRGLQRSFEQLWFEANLSIWAKILKDLGHLNILLLCLELPTSGIPQELQGAVEQIRRAHEDLIAGRFDAVVSRARIAMDAIDTAGETGKARQAALEAFHGSGRNDMPKRQREVLARYAIRHYTHLAHHVDASGSLESFDRHEAMFILSAAAAAIWRALGEILTRNAEGT